MSEKDYSSRFGGRYFFNIVASRRSTKLLAMVVSYEDILINNHGNIAEAVAHLCGTSFTELGFFRATAWCTTLEYGCFVHSLESAVVVCDA